MKIGIQFKKKFICIYVGMKGFQDKNEYKKIRNKQGGVQRGVRSSYYLAENCAGQKRVE